MRQFILPALLAVSYVSAQGSCPGEWWDLAGDLQNSFFEDGTCSDPARAAIRLAFHDCFPGSCDGSIIKAEECWKRPENIQMYGICTVLGEKADYYGVSYADIIQFAAAIGLASCSGGPTISFYAGRSDSSTESDRNAMPRADTDVQTMIQMFQAKGFNKSELVALTGAHTIGRKLDRTPMDSTIGEWDSQYYTETSANETPGFVAADKFMAQSGQVGEDWRYMGKSQDNFMNAFIPAMEKMSLMGFDKNYLCDGSDIIRWYAGDVRERRRSVLSKVKRSKVGM